MKIQNKLDKDLTLDYKGVIYELPAGKADSFAEDVCNQWSKIYGYLAIEVVPDKPEKEEVEEKPKKTVKKKAKETE